MNSVVYEQCGNIAIITLNRPHSLNAIDEKTAEELVKCLQQVAEDDVVRAAIITGAGRAFCAGGDLQALDKLRSQEERRRFIVKVGAMVKAIYENPKPIIAMVNGVAAGAGFNLALTCDLIYASDSTKFIQSFVKVGLSPDCGGFYFLAKAVGIAKAKELMFTARPIGAQEALALGFVNDIFSADELQERVMAVAQEISETAPLALAMTKQGVNNYHATLSDTLAYEALASSMLLGTDDFREGILAFTEKRSPKFTGK